MRSQAQCRRIFRTCFSQYLACTERPKGALGKNEEYIADFELVGLRALTDTVDRQIFRLHFISGADLGTCLRRTGMPIRLFSRVVGRIEEQLGQAFADTDPYPLYPTKAYFSGGRR